MPQLFPPPVRILLIISVLKDGAKRDVPDVGAEPVAIYPSTSASIRCDAEFHEPRKSRCSGTHYRRNSAGNHDVLIRGQTLCEMLCFSETLLG